MIISDLGPDLNSQIFKGLVDLMGMEHKFSIANKHSNGVEREIKELVRHLRAIVYDERIKDIFEDPTVIPSIQYILNTMPSSETGGYTPFEMVFGSQDVIYKDLLANSEACDISHVLLEKLNKNLLIIRDASTKFQQGLIQTRIGDQDLKKQNQYQAGDFVMFDKGPKVHPKMSCRYKGPHEVVSQYKNDVSSRNLITGAILEYSVEDLQPFFGSKAQATEAAMRDQDQYLVESILSYTGDCNTRSKMVFKVKYSDGDIIDRPWSNDIQCEAYYIFCESRPYLKHLAMDTKMGAQFRQNLGKSDITGVSLGDTVYVDLRFFGDEWYEALGLPDFECSSYVMEFQYTHYFHKSSKKKISGIFRVTGDKYSMNNYIVFAWGSVKIFNPENMFLVDQEWIKKYPRLLVA
jgi:hypothetical protein